MTSAGASRARRSAPPSLADAPGVILLVDDEPLLLRALRRAGKRVEMLLVPGVEHGKASWPPAIWQETWQRMLEFLERTLVSSE